MERLVKQDLGLKTRAVTPIPKLYGQGKERRLERAKILLNWMKRGTNAQLIRVFSDEKLFTVDADLNRRNSRYLSGLPVSLVDPEIKHFERGKNPAKVMMLGIVCSDGKKCPPIFIPANERIYLDILETKVVPWLLDNYPEFNFVWQQDGAPAHTANIVQRYLNDRPFQHWPKNFWPPSSPDLNPLDYSIWARMKDDVQGVSHPNIDALKAKIAEKWAAMEEDYIRRVCGSFRRRIEATIAADGGHFS